MGACEKMAATFHPERQPRERAVACVRCMKPTWNLDAVCDNHEDPCPDCNERPCHPQCLSGGGLT